MTTHICIDCGSDYDYDPSNPRGSSSTRCSACRKKNTKFNNYYALLESAGCGTVRCFKCGYRRCPEALLLIDTYEPLKRPTTQEEKVKFAKSQYILCMNCKKEIDNDMVDVEVTDKKSSPIKLAFYEKEVKMVRSKLEDFQPVIPNVEVVQD